MKSVLPLIVTSSPEWRVLNEDSNSQVSRKASEILPWGLKKNVVLFRIQKVKVYFRFSIQQIISNF